MRSDFQIIRSKKTGLNAKDSYVIVRGRISFLRVLGDSLTWNVMTATASEDDGHIQVCTDRMRLVDAAMRFALENGGCPKLERDWMGREYVRFCTITWDGRDGDEFAMSMDSFIQRFFEKFDNCVDVDKHNDREMRELYEALAVDDSGGDVYLSDGVWLSSDGSLRDRGR